MPRLYLTETNFAAGEIAPGAFMRSDTDIYRKGAARALNGRLLLHGGVARRPGLTRVQDFAFSQTGRLEAWPVDDDENFILGLFMINGFGALKIWNAATNAEVFTAPNLPFTDANLAEIAVVSMGTKTLICHTDFPPIEVRWIGPNSFSQAPFAFATGYLGPPLLQPYHQFQKTWIAASAYPDRDVVVTLTAGAPIFYAAHVGTVWKWAGVELEITAVADGFHATAKGREAAPRAYWYPVKDNVGFRQGEPCAISSGEGAGVVIGTDTLGGVRRVAVLPTNSGEWSITADTPKYLVSANVSSRLLDTPAAAAVTPVAPGVFTTDWAEPAFSNVHGWPRTAAFHEGRLVFGGSRDLPNWLFFSVIRDFYSFDEGFAEADSAFKVQIAVEKVQTIRHLVSAKHLQIFTDSAELFIPQSDSQPLTPTTVSVRAQTRAGSGFVRPVVFDGVTHFIPPGGSSVQAFGYVNEEQAYSAPSIAAMSSHLIRDPVDMAAQNPGELQEQYLYVVNADGTLAVNHALRAAGINGWTPWVTEGKFLAAAGVADKVWFLVLRTDQGAQRLFIERLDPAAMVDNFQYPFAFLLQTLPIVVVNGYQAGGKMKRVTRVEARIRESVTLTVMGNELCVYRAGDDISLPPLAKTGLYRFGLTGWSTEAQVTIRQDQPLPLTIDGLHLEVSL